MHLRISKFPINAGKSAVQRLLITSWILTRLEVFLHPTPLSRVDQSRASCDQKKENTGAHCKDQRDRLPVPQDSLLGSSCAPWIRRLVQYLEFRCRINVPFVNEQAPDTQSVSQHMGAISGMDRRHKNNEHTSYLILSQIYYSVLFDYTPGIFERPRNFDRTTASLRTDRG